MSYIDVDKFAEKICNFQAIDENAANAMIWLLRTFPTADVVEVVRCKDCRFWEEYCVKDADEIALLEKEFGFEIRITSACIGECQCKRWQGIGACGIRQTGLNDYCSYGERRDKCE